MQVSAVRPVVSATKPAFTAKIIDSHTHLGHIFGRDYGIDALDKFVKTNIPTEINGKKDFDTIERVIVSNGDAVGGTLNELQGNEKMLNMIRGRKEYLPLAVCQPAKTGGDISQIEQLFQKHPNEFVGLKFHPTVLPVANEAEYVKSYTPYMEFANKHKLPCLFHCQGGQAGAEKIMELAKKVPEVPVILAHAGSLDAEGYANRDAALRVFEESLTKKNANIYLDMSWVGWGNDGLPQRHNEDVSRILKLAKEKNGTHKLLFATDAPLGCFGEQEISHCGNKASYSKAVSYLKEQINQVENSLSLLLAEPVHRIDRTSWRESSLICAEQLSIGLPVQLLANRPDVRAAERALESAFYATNVARSAFYPSVTLSGSAGWTNSAGGAIVNPGKFLASAVGSLTQPLFAQGRIVGQYKIAKAQQEQASLAFQQALLNAGAEVNEALVAYHTSQDKSALFDKQVLALQKAYQSTSLLMKHGNTTYLEVLTAQQSLLSAQLQQTANRFKQNQNLVNLYQALGGGRY